MTALVDVVEPRTIVAEHVARNRRTRDQWQDFQTHRQQVMRLLSDAATDDSGTIASKSLALLGVGNGNDVSLDQLAQQYRGIGLVDLDEEALTHLTQRHSKIADRLQVYGGVDVSGILGVLADMRRDPVGNDRARPLVPHDVDTLLERARQPTTDNSLPPWGGPYDVVVSLTLFSQLMDTAKMVLGSHHPRLVELILAIRDGHWRRICEMLNPGGTGICVSDFVSSATCPELGTVGPDAFPEFVAGLIQQRNFFTGANPFAIQQRLRVTPQLAPLVVDVRVSLPWRWDLGPKVFAVAAISVTRSHVTIQ